MAFMEADNPSSATQEIAMNAIVHKTSGTIADTTVPRASAQGTVRLRRRQHMRLTGAAGRVVAAISGSVWITQDGDIRDIVLEAGQSVTLDRDGPAIISALDEARLRISGGSRPTAGFPALRRLFTETSRASLA